MTILKNSMIGITMNAIFIISTTFTWLTLDIAIAVIGDAPGVANANCVVKNNTNTKPVPFIPTIPANWNNNGMITIVKIKLFATLVITAANTNTPMMNTHGLMDVKFCNTIAIVALKPVSAPVK